MTAISKLSSSAQNFRRSTAPALLARRKQIYEQLHPETKHGANLGLQNRHAGDSGTERAPSFVESTAALTLWSPRTISRFTRIGERLSPDLQAALADTPLAHRTRDLEDIANMDADEQQMLMKRLHDAEQPPPSLSALMTDPNRPSSRPKSNLDRLKALWSKFSANHRRQFIQQLWTEASDAEREGFREWLADPDAQP